MKKYKEKIGFGIVIGVFSIIIITCLISIFFTALYRKQGKGRIQTAC